MNHKMPSVGLAPRLPGSIFGKEQPVYTPNPRTLLTLNIFKVPTGQKGDFSINALTSLSRAPLSGAFFATAIFIAKLVKIDTLNLYEAFDTHFVFHIQNTVNH